MTKKNPILVTDDIIRSPKEILKLDKYVFLTMDIIFVNKIPLLITLSRNIDFTDTSHFPTQKYRDIFKAFRRIYILYFKRGFKITTVHADG